MFATATAREEEVKLGVRGLPNTDIGDAVPSEEVNE